MTPSFSQLEQWVASGESETLEFKRSTGELSTGIRAVCAMLNQRGGRVLFGVDSTGQILGQDVSDRTIEEVASEIGNIDPPVFPTIDSIITPQGRQVIVVTVSRGSTRPYSHKGIAYQRVGNTNRKLSREEYNRMLVERLHGEQRWENQAASDWSIADLDATEIIRTTEEAIRRGRVEDPGTRDPELLLRGFGLMKEGQLLRAAVVLFGLEQQLEQKLPQCMIRIARFRGVDKTEFLDNKQFHGNAFDLLKKAERFLRDSLPIAGRVQPTVFERIDDPLYPPIALREALANALCHRDYALGGGSISIAIYDDRLEITSSGTLHFGLTTEDLFHPHDSLPWNPLIARVFFRRGIIESWGRGTIKIAELTALAGLPRPVIEEVAGCVMVRFLPTRYTPPHKVSREVNERQQKILSLLDNAHHGLALREIYSELAADATERQIREDLAILKTLSLIDSKGHGRGARWILLGRTG